MTNPTHARFDRNQTHARDERSRLVLGTMRRVTKNVAKGRYKVGLLEGLSQDLQLLTPQIVTVHELFCVSRRQQHLDAVRLPYASKILGAAVAFEHENSDEIAAIFSRMTAKGAFVAEWQLRRVPHVDLASVVMDHGRAADLIIAGRTDPDWDLSPLLDFPERLALESGRPVLVIPYAGRYPRIGRNVVIAWKAGRESTRAVFDALPLLKGADNVHILEVKGRADQETMLGPDTSIAAALGRHGIKATIRTSVAPDISVGDEILSRLADLDADLLVMGAYGHSRMREIVFGGATRHIARHMTVPTLFSH